MARSKKTGRMQGNKNYGAAPLAYGGPSGDLIDSAPRPLFSAIPFQPNVRPPPFDQYLCIESFPTVDIDDTSLTQV